VFRRLLEQTGCAYDEALVPVAFEHGEMPQDWPQATAAIACAPVPAVLRAASYLRRAIAASPAAPAEAIHHLPRLDPQWLQQLGQVRVVVGEHNGRAQARSACTYLALLRDQDETTLIGYCDFVVGWTAGAVLRSGNDAQMTVGVGSCWITPARRDRSMVALLRAAVCDAAWRNLLQMDRTAPWTPGRRAAVRVRFVAGGQAMPVDTYLQDCANFFCDWLTTFDGELCHLDIWRVDANVAVSLG
jgi:hypothetical protein